MLLESALKDHIINSMRPRVDNISPRDPRVLRKALNSGNPVQRALSEQLLLKELESEVRRQLKADESQMLVFGSSSKMLGAGARRGRNPQGTIARGFSGIRDPSNAGGGISRPSSSRVSKGVVRTTSSAEFAQRAGVTRLAASTSHGPDVKSPSPIVVSEAVAPVERVEAQPQPAISIGGLEMSSEELQPPHRTTSPLATRIHGKGSAGSRPLTAPSRILARARDDEQQRASDVTMDPSCDGTAAAQDAGASPDADVAGGMGDAADVAEKAAPSLPLVVQVRTVSPSERKSDLRHLDSLSQQYACQEEQVVGGHEAQGSEQEPAAPPGSQDGDENGADEEQAALSRSASASRSWDAFDEGAMEGAAEAEAGEASTTWVCGGGGGGSGVVGRLHSALMLLQRKVASDAESVNVEKEWIPSPKVYWAGNAVAAAHNRKMQQQQQRPASARRGGALKASPEQQEPSMYAPRLTPRPVSSGQRDEGEGTAGRQALGRRASTAPHAPRPSHDGSPNRAFLAVSGRVLREPSEADMSGPQAQARVIGVDAGERQVDERKEQEEEHRLQPAPSVRRGSGGEEGQAIAQEEGEGRELAATATDKHDAQPAHQQDPARRSSIVLMHISAICAQPAGAPLPASTNTTNTPPVPVPAPTTISRGKTAARQPVEEGQRPATAAAVPGASASKLPNTHAPAHAHPSASKATNAMPYQAAVSGRVASLTPRSPRKPAPPAPQPSTWASSTPGLPTPSTSAAAPRAAPPPASAPAPQARKVPRLELGGLGGARADAGGGAASAETTGGSTLPQPLAPTLASTATWPKALSSPRIEDLKTEIGALSREILKDKGIDPDAIVDIPAEPHARHCQQQTGRALSARQTSDSRTQQSRMQRQLARERQGLLDKALEPASRSTKHAQGQARPMTARLGATQVRSASRPLHVWHTQGRLPGEEEGDGGKPAPGVGKGVGSLSSRRWGSGGNNGRGQKLGVANAQGGAARVSFALGDWPLKTATPLQLRLDHRSRVY